MRKEEEEGREGMHAVLTELLFLLHEIGSADDADNNLLPQVFHHLKKLGRDFLKRR